jgi:hypothetical protein
MAASYWLAQRWRRAIFAGMALTWLDVLAGNLGAGAIIAAFLFFLRDWRLTKAWQAGFFAWLTFIFAMTIFTYRAGCWANTWVCS